MATNRFIKETITFIIAVTFISCSKSADKEHGNITTTVFVCSGPQSHCYHFDSLCVAFSNCSGERMEIALDSAVIKYDACGFCVKKDSRTIKDNTDSLSGYNWKDSEKPKKKKRPTPPARNPMEEEIK